jgi:RNA-binding protein YlmH
LKFIKKEINKKSDLLDDEIDEDEKDTIDDLNEIDVSNYKPGFKIVQKSLASMRCDSVLSSGLNISRRYKYSFDYLEIQLKFIRISVIRTGYQNWVPFNKLRSGLF